MFGTPNPFNANGAPYINNADYQGVSINGIVPRSQYTKVFSGEQNYSWNRGQHQLEFGWRYRQEILDTLPDAPEQSDSVVRQQRHGDLQSVHRYGVRHPGADRRQRRQFLPGHRRFVRAAAAAAELQHEGQGHRRRTFRTTGRSAAT